MGDAVVEREEVENADVDKVEVEREGAELIDLVLTCQENIDDPNIGEYLETLTEHIQQLVSNDRHKVTVKKVEPWNSIRVTLNITREAAEHLRRLAELGDQSLLDLGILSVQVDEDRIVLRTGNGKDSSEIVLTTGRTTRPTTTQSDNGTNQIIENNLGMRTEMLTQTVSSTVGGSSSSMTTNLTSESDHLKREFDQYMHGLIRGRINCVSSSAPMTAAAAAAVGSRNRELSESDWDAMRDALYPNELLSPDRRIASPRQRREHESSPRAQHGKNPFPSDYRIPPGDGRVERMNDFMHHGGGGGYIGALNPWNERSGGVLSPTYGEGGRHGGMNPRLCDFTGETVNEVHMMMQLATDGVVAPKKRKRVRKQKVLKDTALESSAEHLPASDVAINKDMSRDCKSGETSMVSSAHDRVTDPGTSVNNMSPSPYHTPPSSKQHCEPIVNPVTGLLEPDHGAWTADRTADHEDHVTEGEGGRRFNDESMFPLVSLHPPPNPLVALHSRIIANQNQALSPATAPHRFPYPPTSGGGGGAPPHNDAHGSQRHHLSHAQSVEKNGVGPSPRKRARSVKTNGTTTTTTSSQVSVAASRSLSNVGGQESFLRHPSEWNNDQRISDDLLRDGSGGGCRGSPGASSNAISSKKAVERALEMLFDDDNDEESMKLDFDLLLSKNKNKKTTTTVDACSKVGVTPAKKARKSKKSIVTSLSEPGWHGPGPALLDHRRSVDEEYLLEADGVKRNQYLSSKVNEMMGLSHPPTPQGAVMGGDNLRGVGPYSAGAGRLSPFGMSPRLDDRKLLLDYRRIMADMEPSNVHELLESNYQMTQRNYANILSAMNRERTNNGGVEPPPPAGRPLQHLVGRGGHSVHLREYGRGGGE